MRLHTQPPTPRASILTLAPLTHLPVRSECPSATHTAIQALTDRLCYAGMPLPPPSAAPSSRPPSPPLAPPPLAQRYGQLRLASAELPSDEDCAFVTYAACRDAAVELGTALRLSTDIEISLSACERGDDTQSCFLGCSLGAQVSHSSRAL